MKLVAACSFSDFNDVHSDGINAIFANALMQTSVVLVCLLVDVSLIGILIVE